jgi:cytochrome c oxidase subunit 4
MSEHGSHDIAGGYGPEHVVRLQPGVDPHHDGHGHDGDHDHGGVGKYLLVFVALCVLTGASFFTYTEFWPFKDQKQITWAFMMAVSCTKAMLVIMFFMHLLWEANWKWVLTIPASFMSIFLMLMLVPDIGWRQDNGFARYSDERLLYAADPPAVEAAEEEAAEHQLQHDAAEGEH